MAIILTRSVLIDGTVYKTGTDVSQIATPGEIQSLVPDSAKRSGHTPKPEADEDPAPSEDPETDDSPELTVPSDAVNEDAPVASMQLDEGIVNDLQTAGITTVRQVRDYLDEHGHFRGITGIGKVGDAKIKASLDAKIKASLGE